GAGDAADGKFAHEASHDAERRAMSRVRRARPCVLRIHEPARRVIVSGASDDGVVRLVRATSPYACLGSTNWLVVSSPAQRAMTRRPVGERGVALRMFRV